MQEHPLERGAWGWDLEVEEEVGHWFLGVVGEGHLLRGDEEGQGASLEEGNPVVAVACLQGGVGTWEGGAYPGNRAEEEGTCK